MTTERAAEDVARVWIHKHFTTKDDDGHTLWKCGVPAHACFTDLAALITAERERAEKRCVSLLGHNGCWEASRDLAKMLTQHTEPQV